MTQTADPAATEATPAATSAAYVEHGTCTRDDTVGSVLLDGFTADVAAVFDAPETGA